MVQALKFFIILFFIGLTSLNLFAEEAKTIQLTSAEKEWLKAHQTIRIGVDPVFPPFDYLEEDGKYEGIFADYTNLIGKRIGITILPVFLNWSDVLAKANSRNLDIFYGSETLDRRAYMKFTKPFFTMPFVIINRQETPFITGIKDLTGKNIAVPRDFSIHKYLLHHFPNINLYPFENTLQAIQAVSTGRADAFAGNLIVATYLIQKYNLVNLKVAAPIKFDEAIKIAVRSDWQELVSIMNKVIASITHEEHHQIREKWLSIRYEKGIDWKIMWKWIFIVSGISVLILILILHWNRRLAIEIDERTQVEKELRKSEKRYRELFDRMTSGVAVYQAIENGNNFVFKDFNRSAEQIDQIKKEAVIGKRVTAVFPSVKEFGIFKVFQRVWQTGKPEFFPEALYQDKRNSGSWRENHVYKLPSGEIIAVYNDVTAHKEAENKLKATLEEKEVLLREVHHRVKNNLQALIYLIDMQADIVNDLNVFKAMNELQGRIRAMALVHEKLYQSDDLSQINLGIYLEEMVYSQFYALSQGRPILLQVDAENITIGIDIAIPCGLIINELITNALKYAFPNKNSSDKNHKLWVAVKSQQSEYILNVSDNGVGLPPGLDWRTAKSLGLKLVNIWTTYQLNGTIELGSHGGTAWTIRFSERKKKERR